MRYPIRAYQTDQSSHYRSSSHCPAALWIEERKDFLTLSLTGDTSYRIPGRSGFTGKSFWLREERGEKRGTAKRRAALLLNLKTYPESPVIPYVLGQDLLGSHRTKLIKLELPRSLLFGAESVQLMFRQKRIHKFEHVPSHRHYRNAFPSTLGNSIVHEP